jgi:LytS/YehU family sensor histidine kinase
MGATLRFWLVNFSFWTFYYVANGTTFIMYLMLSPLNRFAALATVMFWILLFTGLYAFTYHRFRFNERPLRFQVLQAIISILLIWGIDLSCRWYLNHLIFPFLTSFNRSILQEPNIYSQAVFASRKPEEMALTFNTLRAHNEMMKFFTLSGWIVAYNLIQYYVLLRKTQVKQLEVENHLKEVELVNLRQQLNPHFLFNALNSIHALASLKEDKTESAVLNLSDLMRYHLNYEKRDFVTVKEELDTVRKYLELEKIRYDNRLTYDIQADEAVLNHQIPLIMVQTLVENAIKHSVRHHAKGGSVQIKAYQNGDFLKIDVINSGQYAPSPLQRSPMRQESSRTVSEQKTGGIGLENTRKRLEMLYGNKASLSIGNKNDSEVVASLSFPMS